MDPRLGGIQQGTVDVGGEPRDFLVYEPPAVLQARSVPLVVALSGCPMTAETFALDTRLDDAARVGGFIVVYPDPVEGCWNAGSCCSASGAANVVDDVGFIARLVDHVSATFPVDQGRVFAVGVSAGGMMAYRLACELSTRFAGIVSVAGALAVRGCAPTRPVSVLEIHGTSDTHVPFAGTPDLFPSTPSTARFWTAVDGCTTQDPPARSGITLTSTWVGCRGGTTVRLDTVDGGQHTWFGSQLPDVSDPIPGEPDATAAAWSFLSRLPLRS
jgi:polyhydroxybutyrate depolymerase